MICSSRQIPAFCNGNSKKTNLGPKSRAGFAANAVEPIEDLINPKLKPITKGTHKFEPIEKDSNPQTITPTLVNKDATVNSVNIFLAQSSRSSL